MSVVGRGRGVMRRWSGVGVVTPVVAGVADHPGHPGAPRRRLQRRPGWLVPSSGARLAAHVHSEVLDASRPLAEEEREQVKKEEEEEEDEGVKSGIKREREREKRTGGRKIRNAAKSASLPFPSSSQCPAGS